MQQPKSPKPNRQKAPEEGKRRMLRMQGRMILYLNYRYMLQFLQYMYHISTGIYCAYMSLYSSLAVVQISLYPRHPRP
jgi:hypothetical protein